MNIQPGWTDERIQTLKSLRAAGMSCGRIALEFGDISRNAVIGKLHRLGMRSAPTPRPERDSSVVRRADTRRNGFRKPPPIVPPEPVIIDLPPDTSEFACHITALQMDMCRFPLGDPSAVMQYCGAQSVGPWCCRHKAIVYLPLPPRNR